MLHASHLPLSALDLARRIEAGDLTPAKVVDICARAIAIHEEEVAAFAVFDVEGARRTAELDVGTLAKLPLRGLPIGAKDIFDTTDFPTEYGSPIYAGHRPKMDAALITAVREAGGIVFGKTITTEFAYLHPGPTRNPHNLEHTPGGSSSGSAAAVAAGMLPLALASQTGGSTIRPAAFCGVAALKPSFGLLPTVGMKGMAHTIDTAGLIAAGVADVAFALSAICGRDYRVDTTASGAPRIALVRTNAWTEASKGMQNAVETALRLAETAGARIEEIILPGVFEEASRIHATIQGYEAHHAMAFEYESYRNQISPVLRKAIEFGGAIKTEDYERALQIAEDARREISDLMGRTDVLLTPSALGAAPKTLLSTGTSQFNRLWTLLGNPCINVPGLFDESGLPLGVQLIGRAGEDRSALLAAHFIEQAIIRRH